MPALFALTLALLSCCWATEYEYLSWQSDLYTGGRIYGKQPQCVDIPDDLRLCHNVGYQQMLLPNLLEHETMAEVRQQAGSWVPLVHKNCHPGTQVFLCSLFAPVCLDRPIYPCRWLCEAVRDGCTPIMEAFGFPWPEMLTCEKFPQDDVCIAMSPANATETTKTQDSGICPPCDNEMQTDVILEHMCASEFEFASSSPACTCFLALSNGGGQLSCPPAPGFPTASLSTISKLNYGRRFHWDPARESSQHKSELNAYGLKERRSAIKTKIKEVKRENSDRKVILQKKKKALKLGSLKKKDMKKLVLYLKNGADCPCQQLDNLGNMYLIMGRKVDKQYLLTGIHKWDKSSKEFKKAMKKVKSHKCPAFETVFK
ncbi:SFRP1 protein, partial [Polyodon spathula]|nr:SFRP1 protein [Polyodon spathula]